MRQRRFHVAVSLGVLAGALVSVWPLPRGAGATGLTEIASLDAGGAPANGPSSSSALTGDGEHLAFLSAATDLVAGFTAGAGAGGSDENAYLRDLVTGTTVLASPEHGTTTTGANDDVRELEVADDGCAVVFASNANNLTAPGVVPNRNLSHVYRHDVCTGVTTLVDVTNGGANGNGNAAAPSISADGRYVAFSSNAANMGSTTNIGQTQVYVRDTVAGTTTLVSHGLLGPTNGPADPSYQPEISGDGRYVAFHSWSNDIIAQSEGNGFADVFRWDRNSGQVRLVSAVPGNPNRTANSNSDDASISRNGRWVVFESHATDLGFIDDNPVGGSFPSHDDVFLRDMDTNTTYLVSASATDANRTTNGYSDTASWLDTTGHLVSDDGRFVVFGSTGTDVVTGLSTGGYEHTYVRDRVAGTTEAVSLTPGGALGNGSSNLTPGSGDGSPSISGDGRVVAWNSHAANLVPGDTNGRPDVFVRWRDGVRPTPPTTTTFAPPTTTTTVAPGGGGGGGGSGATDGYWITTDAGEVFAFGNAEQLPQPPPGLGTIVDIEPTPTGHGYLILAGDGTVVARGDGVVRSQAPPLAPGELTTSISMTPTGLGYWLFTSRGRVLAWGDAPFLGDLTTLQLAAPVLDSVATPTGRGYYLVASDGGVFAFGDARFLGSMGGQRLNAPVQSLVPTVTGAGYWLVASDGGVFAFGDAGFRGSMGDQVLNRPVAGMVRFGTGYLMVAEDGGVFVFSDLPFQGSLGGNPPPHPVVAVAAVP